MKKSIFFLWGYLLVTSVVCAEEAVLNIYNWFEVIPREILNQFETETGIKINYDVYDSNELLEAKLLTGNSGYDIVGPSAFPFLARQIPAGIYQPLNKKLIPHLENLDPLIMERLARADPGNMHAVPLTWGLVGFGYNARMIRKISPDAPLDSWAVFYDVDVVRKLSACKVNMLEEAGEVILPLFIFKSINPLTERAEDLKTAAHYLQAIRPYIARFDALHTQDDLLSGQVCVAAHWVGTLERTKALQRNAGQGQDISIVVPREGTVLWMDTLAIPHTAPHPGNAHRFIDFLLQPHIIAQITNHTYFANPVPASKEFIRPEIRNNKNIYPAQTDFHKFYMNESIQPRFNRLMNRAMLKFRTGFQEPENTLPPVLDKEGAH